MQTRFFLHINKQLYYCFYDRMRPHAIAYKKKKKKKKKKKTKTKTKKKTNTLLSARACPPKVEGV